MFESRNGKENWLFTQKSYRLWGQPRFLFKEDLGYYPEGSGRGRNVDVTTELYLVSRLTL